MKYFFICAILYISFASAKSQSLIPLDKWMDERPSWLNDTSEMAYFTVRCNSLLSLVSQFFISRARHQEDMIGGQKVKQDSEAYILPVIVFGRASGYEYTDVMARSSTLIKIYSEQMGSSKEITNSIFSGYLGDDFKIYTSFSEEFANISIDLNQQLEKK